MKLTQEELQKMIADAMFGQPNDGVTIQLTTCIGGAIDVAAKWYHIDRKDVTSEHLQAMIDSGWCTVDQWEENGEKFMAFHFK